MLMFDIPFATTDWSGVERTEHAGETGKAFWRTRNFSNIRVRMVEYTPGYLADHWCQKGHVLLVLEGELHTELADGRTVVLRQGQSYQVADGAGQLEVVLGEFAKVVVADFRVVKNHVEEGAEIDHNNGFFLRASLDG